MRVSTGLCLQSIFAAQRHQAEVLAVTLIKVQKFCKLLTNGRNPLFLAQVMFSVKNISEAPLRPNQSPVKTASEEKVRMSTATFNESSVLACAAFTSTCTRIVHRVILGIGNHLKSLAWRSSSIVRNSNELRHNVSQTESVPIFR